MADDEAGLHASVAPIFARSTLFVPGNRLDLIPKAVDSGADAIVLDLEDATPESEKSAARTALVRELPSIDTRGTNVLVRINPLSHPEVLADIECALSAKVLGIMIPKVESAADVALIDRMLSWMETARGFDCRNVAIVPLLESGAAVHHAYEIATASRRIVLMGWTAAPGGDLSSSVGFTWSGEFFETLTMRSNVLLAARAANVPNPTCGVWTDIDDLEGLRRFAQQNQQLGYEGMYAIHPGHVNVINEVFAPTMAEIDHDRRLLAVMESASRAGAGVAVFEGAMVDEAMAAASRRRIARAEALTSGERP